MNRQWMYGDRHTREYIKGVHEFLDAAEANKKNGLCIVHVLSIGI